MVAQGNQYALISASNSFETLRPARLMLSHSMINGTLVEITSYKKHLNAVIKERNKTKDNENLIETNEQIQKS